MSIQEVMAGLQKNYLASMPEKISLIETLFRANDLEKLETEYHKLKGTGRTYGLPEFTDLGATLEKICKLAPSQLPSAVPASLTLLSRMRDARAQGGPGLSLDSEPDYLVLMKMVPPPAAQTD